jgi:hypothetical protein
VIAGTDMGFTFQGKDSNTFATYVAAGTKMGTVDWAVSGNTLTLNAQPASGIASGKYIKNEIG